MAYSKTNWVNNTTPINETNLNKIEQGIYDNSLVVDAVTNTLNPTDTETYKTAELTEGQITDVIGVNDIILKGNTSQQQYSGKNLLNVISNVNDTANGITSSIEKNGFQLKLNGTSQNSTAIAIGLNKIQLPQTGTYYLVAQIVSGSVSNSFGFAINFGKDNIINLSNSTKSGKTSFNATKTTGYLALFTQSNISFNNLIINFQVISTDTLDLDFEPYVGGTASPNPDYPQDIEVVTGNNKIIVSGKNLVPITAKSVERNGVTFTINNNQLTINGTATKNILFFLNNEIWSYSANNPILEAGTYNLSFNNEIKFIDGGIAITIYNENSELIYNNAKVKNNFSFSISEKGSCTIRMEITKGQVFDNNDLQFQIEQGSTATDYEPYVGRQDFPISLGSLELCKIGKYQDYIYKQDDKWYKHKMIKKTILNGTEKWTYNDELKVFFTDDYKGEFASLSCFSNFFINKSFNGNNGAITIGNTYHSSYQTLHLTNWNITTVSDWKNWLSNNKPIVYFTCYTPTEEEITDTTLISQLEAIYNAPLYEQTNITQTNNDLPMVLDITAFKDNINGIKALLSDVNEIKSVVNNNADNLNKMDEVINAKQDKLTAGTNITISNNTISAKDTTYSTATSSIDGLMSKNDKSKLDNIFNSIYPVGSVYISVNSTNPASLFGGTWEQIKDRFLLACGSTYNAGATGGEATHKLTIDEMPSHNHTWGWKKSAASGNNAWDSAGSDKTGTSSDIIGNTGGGQPHNNMPPYLGVYMWKRTK